MSFKLIIIFSIFILKLLPRDRIFTSGEKFTNGKLINVADKMNNATCTSSNDFPSNPSYTFFCENIMDPIWVNFNYWAASCNSGPCNLQWINITFQKQYDIVEVCLYQRTLKEENRVNTATIQMNNQNKTYVLSDIQTCFLLEEDFGSKSSSIRLNTVECRNLGGGSTGYSSISALAYSNDQDSMEDKDYENIAQMESGATCSSSSELSINKCEYSLDWAFSTIWRADCSPIFDCVGQYINVTFARTTKPEIFCLANIDNNHRIKILEIKWSSQYTENITLPNNGLRYYFNYANYPSIESGFILTIKDYYSGNNLGLATIQVFAKRNFSRVYTIQTEDYVIYYIPEKYQNNLRALTFKVQGQKHPDLNSCSSLLISFKNESSIQFSIQIDMSNNVENLLILVQGESLSVNKFKLPKSLIECEKWNEFWFEILNGKIYFGSGNFYGRNTLAIVKANNIINNFTQIMLKNNGSDVINHFQILDLAIVEGTILELTKGTKNIEKIMPKLLGSKRYIQYIPIMQSLLVAILKSRQETVLGSSMFFMENKTQTLELISLVIDRDSKLNMAPICYICEERIYGRQNQEKCQLCCHLFKIHKKCLDYKDQSFYCNICCDISMKKCIVALQRLPSSASANEEIRQTPNFDTANNRNEQTIVCENHCGNSSGNDTNGSIMESHNVLVEDLPAQQNNMMEVSFIVSPKSDCEKESYSFKILKGMSQKGKDLLLFNNFCYNIKEKRNKTTFWICSVRNKRNKCSATVSQHGNSFYPGKLSHSHERVPDLEQKIMIRNELKNACNKDISSSGKRLAEDVLVKHCSSGEVIPSLDNCTRLANWTRKKFRPAEPQSIHFNLAKTFIPDDFLQMDIQMENDRILIFSTTKQIELLSKGKIWFMDGTFKCVKDPFYQLFSIHGFIKKNGEIKQIPMAFAFMGSKRKTAYKKLFKAIQDLTNGHSPKKVVVDFEKAIWKALSFTYPEANIKGCVFHWTQAIYRKIQELGLCKMYKEKKAEYRIMKKLMALPFLPSDLIEPTFKTIKEISPIEMKSLLEYIETQWINGFYKPEVWSVYGEAIRTNNDLEGWHHRLNKNLCSNTAFYLLLDELKREADLIKLYKKLLSEKKICRQQRKAYQNIQSKIFSLWEQFEIASITSLDLLDKASDIYSPV
ncbi:DgyrCDS14576 [Dimorphilus gyrociliatus]|uniref:DgyrCDS14576 n=1 Tax=Dimorphilus gyrociliatus TaxID=2664684 RepID=A0A7I8WE33_9ANNE|nr:DgyrCDS14576 [Dimorphilus gyrociliatus]